MIELLRGTWRFRDFILSSVKREFASRYLGTQLGIVWPIIHPLTLILIYTLVFGEVMRTRLAGHESRFAYSIYLTAGFIAWNLFGELLQRSVGIFVHNSALLKKVSVHKLAFPAIASLSALIQVGILLVCFLVFLIASGNFPGIALIAVVPVIAITGFLAMGLGLFLATINVFYRDVEHTTNVALQFWFWITPIAYPIAALPPVAQRIIAWNPMSPVVAAMQDIFVAQRFPDWGSLAYPVVLAMALAIMARLSFGRLADELVDEL